MNGLRVSSVDEAAAAIIRILKDPTLGEKLGKAARETVRKRFLMSRELEQKVDLASAFEGGLPPTSSGLPNSASPPFMNRRILQTERPAIGNEALE